ncbi:hypothetical protein KR018_001183 [Drosophila ironensis]|nr:hypothetical protein KR018_001183 [Drosophila ironensis]
MEKGENQDAIQSSVEDANVATLEVQSVIKFDAVENTDEATAEKELPQETTTAGKTLEKPAEVAQEAELEKTEATQPNEMLAKAETGQDMAPQLPSATLGPILPCANIVKVETNSVHQTTSAALGPVVPQVENEIFSIFAAQGPIISASTNQDLDSSSGSDFEEVPSLPPQDEDEHSPKGSKRCHGKAEKEEPCAKKQRTQDKTKTYRLNDGA